MGVAGVKSAADVKSAASAVREGGLSGKVFLVTGVAGFIGFHVAGHLLELGACVVGYDNVNDYYSVALKEARLAELERRARERGCGSVGAGFKPARRGGRQAQESECERYAFVRADLADKASLEAVFEKHRPSIVIHLAAQAGVRYSLENPDAYVRSNLVGFVNILECCRHFGVEHLLYASSSSVYGSNEKLPFSVEDRVDNPISLYAATKKSNELLAHTYSHLFNLPTTGMRFFTVYGPWGRPDMAAFLFLEAICAGKAIKVFNNGNMMRDFTYVDDVVKSVVALVEKSAALKASSAASSAVASHATVRDFRHCEGACDRSNPEKPYKVYNIGNNCPEKLLDFIGILEELTGKTAIKELLPLQPGDVPKTFADIDELLRDTGVRPETPLRTGLERFVEWHREWRIRN